MLDGVGKLIQQKWGYWGRGWETWRSRRSNWGRRIASTFQHGRLRQNSTRHRSLRFCSLSASSIAPVPSMSLSSYSIKLSISSSTSSSLSALSPRSSSQVFAISWAVASLCHIRWKTGLQLCAQRMKRWVQERWKHDHDAEASNSERSQPRCFLREG